jgi:hypothetical protein
MHVKPRAINYSPGTRAFSFEIFISDLPRDKEDKTGYQAESITDCSLIFQDLINEIHLGNMFGDDVVLTRPVNSEPFVEQYTHTLTGVTGIIELSLDYDWSACSIPASWNYNTPTNSPNDGFGALQFIESLHQDGVFVSLDNDLEAPGNSYYYGTNASGVKGWYAIVDNIGLTCETLPDCAVIISITDDIAALQTDVALKANTADLGATAFSNDYNDLDNLPTLPTGTVTSVGLTMPSAFSVANSPITSSGDIAVTGAGTVSQYVRGDGSLANFPSSTGGGSSLTFYLNGSVAQGTFGGVAFKEMDRVPVLGVGTDFTIATNGYIQSFITDANVPNLLEIPAGNWNFETYFSASSNGGSPSFYIELYKWDGATLSLIASNSATPEGITNGTAIDLYVSALAIPQTTLAATDRLAIRIYVTHSGRTIKLHTENSHLCQVITTFSTGLTALNGLTAQVQNFATGTSGTDFAISSATSTHTFNLPTASAANRGALSSADWTTFNSKLSGLTVGTTAIASGAVGRVLFEGTGNVLQESANLFWDNTNGRLGIGTSTPSAKFDIYSTSLAQSVFSVGESLATKISINQSSVRHQLFSISRIGGTSPPLFYIGAGSGPTAASTIIAANNDNLIFGYDISNTFNETFRITTNKNFLIGTTTDAGYKLDVNGTARVSGYTLFGTGNSGTPLATLADFRGTSDNDFIQVARVTASSDRYVRLYANGRTDTKTSSIGDIGFQYSAADNNSTSGTRGLFTLTNIFNPTTGTAIYNSIAINQTINQTGGANGITRGLYINPTLTAAADFRAIEVASGITILGAATTAKASLRIPSGTAPTSPVNGDIWFDGTNIQMRIGGVTKTFTLL